MRRLFVCAAIGARIFYAQVAFDAASVKVNTSGDGHTSAHSGPGGIEMSNVTLRFCIRRAYHLTDPQIVGPSWLDTDHFDIVAKVPSGAPEEQIPEMLLALLAERFKLVAHREPRELAVYALVVAKGGPKLTKVEEATSGGDMSSSRSEVNGAAVKISRLVEFLSTTSLNLGLPVVDQTGLAGAYTFNLKWTPERPLNATETPKKLDLDAPPPIFEALQEQLGLKLEKRKAPLEVLIVDRAERVPTEN
jgi:uncharacterized protein (TIGR03435 family)